MGRQRANFQAVGGDKNTKHKDKTQNQVGKAG